MMTPKNMLAWWNPSQILFSIVKNYSQSITIAIAPLAYLYRIDNVDPIHPAAQNESIAI